MSNNVTYQMQNYRGYGVAYLPPDVFKQLDIKYFIPPCTDNIKYMRANRAEARHLEGLGVILNKYCDYYKLVRVGNEYITNT